MGDEKHRHYGRIRMRLTILTLVTTMTLALLVKSLSSHGNRLRPRTSKHMLSMQAENHGYAFYKSIGSPKFISAPMVDQSELAWRLMVKQNGVDLVSMPL